MRTLTTVQWFHSRASDKNCGSCNLKMKVLKRTFLKFTVLIALLVLFYFYYFRVVFKQFTEQLTNTAKFEEKITVTEPPTITICFDPIFKPSVLEAYNINDWIFFQDRFPEVMKDKTIKVNGQFFIFTDKGQKLYQKFEIVINGWFPSRKYSLALQYHIFHRVKT